MGTQESIATAFTAGAHGVGIYPGDSATRATRALGTVIKSTRTGVTPRLTTGQPVALSNIRIASTGIVLAIQIEGAGFTNWFLARADVIAAKTTGTHTVYRDNGATTFGPIGLLSTVIKSTNTGGMAGGATGQAVTIEPSASTGIIQAFSMDITRYTYILERTPQSIDAPLFGARSSASRNSVCFGEAHRYAGKDEIRSQLDRRQDITLAQGAVVELTERTLAFHVIAFVSSDVLVVQIHEVSSGKKEEKEIGSDLSAQDPQ